MLKKLYERSRELRKLRRQDSTVTLFPILGFNEDSLLACCYLRTSSLRRGIVVTCELRKACEPRA
jgi:hypothetical protein